MDMQRGKGDVFHLQNMAPSIIFAKLKRPASGIHRPAKRSKVVFNTSNHEGGIIETQQEEFLPRFDDSEHADSSTGDINEQSGGNIDAQEKSKPSVPEPVSKRTRSSVKPTMSPYGEPITVAANKNGSRHEKRILKGAEFSRAMDELLGPLDDPDSALPSPHAAQDDSDYLDNALPPEAHERDVITVDDDTESDVSSEISDELDPQCVIVDNPSPQPRNASLPPPNPATLSPETNLSPSSGEGAVQVSTSLGIPDLPPNAGPSGLAVQADVDFTQPPTGDHEADDSWLASKGYTPEIISKGNDMFPKGSLFRARLDALIAWRSKGEAVALSFQETKFDPAELGGSPDCRPSRRFRQSPFFAIPLLEPAKGGSKYTTSCQRIVAIYKPGGLSDSEMWKAVAPFQQGAKAGTACLFECSARCNLFGDIRNHCLTAEHLNMETGNQNTLRKTHHGGYAGCFHTEPCLGNQVILRSWSAREITTYVCETPNCNKRKLDGRFCRSCRQAETLSHSVRMNKSTRASRIAMDPTASEEHRAAARAVTSTEWEAQVTPGVCVVVGCEEPSGVGRWCHKHQRPCRGQPHCINRVATITQKCNSCRQKCIVYDCSNLCATAEERTNLGTYKKVTPYCHDHQFRCPGGSHTCKERVGIHEGFCARHAKGNPPLPCMFPGCSFPQLSGMPLQFCRFHYHPCSTEGCNGRRQNNQARPCNVCVERDRSSRKCAQPGCNNSRARPEHGGHSEYCSKHNRRRKIDDKVDVGDDDDDEGDDEGDDDDDDEDEDEDEDESYEDFEAKFVVGNEVDYV